MDRRNGRGAIIPPEKIRGSEFLKAAVVRLPPDWDWGNVIMVGCGGTGGWLAPALARIAYTLKRNGKIIRLIFVDPDTVEEVNIGRQNFCPAEIGRNKAKALAERYGTAWGIEIEAVPEPWEKAELNGLQNNIGQYRIASILVGCVDNAIARKQIARAVEYNSCWWLDCGNGKNNGQVLLGNLDSMRRVKKPFPSKKICIALPAPHVQEPTLLVPRPEEHKAARLSCAELAARNAQSLAINQRVAAEAADMLVRLLVTHDLKRFAVYFDLASGTAVSKYVTPETVKSCMRRKK
jgi:PRTRC genetic system ThiF family protein